MEIEDIFVFQISRLIFLEPLGVHRHYVPHLKGLISGNLEPRAQGHDGNFIFCHALVEKAILHLKEAKGV